MRIELCMSRPLRTCTVGNKGLGAKMSCLASREIHRAYLDVRHHGVAQRQRHGARGQRRHDVIGHVAHSAATEIAMQRSPAEPQAAPMSASMLCSRSASGITTMWFLTRPPTMPSCRWFPARSAGARGRRRSRCAVVLLGSLASASAG